MADATINVPRKLFPVCARKKKKLMIWSRMHMPAAMPFQVNQTNTAKRDNLVMAANERIHTVQPYIDK